MIHMTMMNIKKGWYHSTTTFIFLRMTKESEHGLISIGSDIDFGHNDMMFQPLFRRWNIPTKEWSMLLWSCSSICICNIGRRVIKPYQPRTSRLSCTGLCRMFKSLICQDQDRFHLLWLYLRKRSRIYIFIRIDDRSFFFIFDMIDLCGHTTWGYHH